MVTGQANFFPVKNNWLQPRTLFWLTGAALLCCLLGWYHQEVGTFLAFLKDREAVSVYLRQLGYVGPWVLAFLLALQVVLGSISGQILLIASGYVYGFWPAFWLNLLVLVGTSQLVFGLARRWGRPWVARFISQATLDKWLLLADRKGMWFFCLAFMTPIVPGDLLNYVAGLTPLSGRRFLVANVCGRVPSTLFFTLMGAMGIALTPALVVSFVLVGLLAVVLWFLFVTHWHVAHTTPINDYPVTPVNVPSTKSG